MYSHICTRGVQIWGLYTVILQKVSWFLLVLLTINDLKSFYRLTVLFSFCGLCCGGDISLSETHLVVLLKIMMGI